jgi:CheY-like chemotaxis protein
MPRPTNALIVDDEAHVRLFAKLLLKQQGIEQTWEAANGQEALAMVRQHNPELVMLDINLPLLSGLEVLGMLRQERRRRPVIMLTSQSSIKAVLECVNLGATAYILKHSPKAEAAKALAEALDGLADESDEADEPGA